MNRKLWNELKTQEYIEFGSILKTEKQAVVSSIKIILFNN